MNRRKCKTREAGKERLEGEGGVGGGERWMGTKSVVSSANWWTVSSHAWMAAETKGARQWNGTAKKEKKRLKAVKEPN